MKYITLIAVFLLSLWGNSQENQSTVFNLSTEKFPHTSYLGSESVNPFIINQIQVFLNTRVHPIFSITLKSNSGNTMVHSTVLNSSNGGNIQIAYDAVFEKDAFQFTYPINSNIEGFVELGLNSSTEKGLFSPMNWMVRDDFIEKFHTAMGKDDLYKRKELGFSHFTGKTINEQGDEHNLQKDAVYTKPLVLGATYYFNLKQSNYRVTSLNTSVLLKFPLETIASKYLETGISLNVSSTKKTGNKTSLTSSILNSLYYHGNTTSNNYANHERKLSYKFTGLLGLNIHSKRNENKYSLFLSLNKTTSRLKSKYYSTNGNELNRQALSAATEGNEYFEIGGNYTFNFMNRKALILELTIREDLVLDISDLNNLLNGRNSEDFGVFFGLQFSML